MREWWSPTPGMVWVAEDLVASGPLHSICVDPLLKSLQWSLRFPLAGSPALTIWLASVLQCGKVYPLVCPLASQMSPAYEEQMILAQAPASLMDNQHLHPSNISWTFKYYLRYQQLACTLASFLPCWPLCNLLSVCLARHLWSLSHCPTWRHCRLSMPRHSFWMVMKFPVPHRQSTMEKRTLPVSCFIVTGLLWAGSWAPGHLLLSGVSWGCSWVVTTSF